MNIHSHARHVFEGHPEERRAVRSLEGVLYVTYASKHETYLYALARLEEAAKARFNLERELLIVFSPFERTDMRTINALKQLRKSYQDRAHQTVALLFHKCEGAHRDSIERLCRDEFENDLVIVPLAIQDVMDADDPLSYVVRAFRKHIGESELFERSTPLRSDRFFYGRSDLVRRIADGTVTKQEHYGVFGVRKAGKTSLLFAIQRSLGQRVISCYIDCENPDLSTGNWATALGVVFSRLAEAAKVEPRLTFDSEQPVESLRGLVNQVLSKRAAHICILLDEIEHITPKSLTKPWRSDFILFWRALRSISQEVGNRLTFIVAGVNASAVGAPHVEGDQNPLYELLNREFLPPLGEEDVRVMISELGSLVAVRFEDEVGTWLRRQFGGHPLATRIACALVLGSVQQRSDRVADVSELAGIVAVQHFEALDSEIYARLETVAREILVTLALWYPDEYDVLHMMSETPDDLTVVGMILEAPVWNNNLKLYGLVDHEARPLPFLARYLRRDGGWFRRTARELGGMGVEAGEIAGLATSMEVAELAELRRRCERQLRLLIVRQLMTATRGDASAVAKKVASHIGRGASEFVGVGLKEIVDGLYLVELTKIIAGEWQVFAWIFGNEEARFVELARIANQLGRRLEAHSRDITSDEMDAGRSALAWIADRMEKSGVVGEGL